MRHWSVLVFLLAASATMAQSNWARRIGSWSNDAFNSMVLDNSGNTYVTGEFGGAIGLGSSTIVPIGSLDILIAKFDPSGSLIWHRTFGASGIDRGADLVLDPTGALIVTGVFMGTVNIDGTTITSAGNTLDMFVLKMNENDGSVQWVKHGGGSGGADQPNNVTVSTAGTIAVTGEFSGTSTFGPNTISSTIDPGTSQPSVDIFVASYDGAGNELWLKHGAAEFADRGMAAAYDLAGNVYVTGQFSDTITFDQTHGNAMSSAIFIIKFDPAGNEDWFRIFGGGIYNQVFDIMLVEGDRLLLTGDIQGTVIFLDTQPDMFTASAPRSSFLVEVDLNGEFLQQNTWGSVHPINTRSLSVLLDEVIVLGRFQCQLTGFSAISGTGTWLATGQHDLYVARFQLLDLQFKDAQQFGGQGNKVPGAIVHTSAGAPLFCGSFERLLVFPGIPNSFNTSPAINSVLSAPAPNPYCLDPDYDSYVGLRGNALMDAFIAQGFTEGREPYDVFSRSGPICDRSQKDAHIVMLGQGVVGPDSLSVCAQATLGVNTFTAFVPDTAIKHNAPEFSFLWSNGSTDPTLPITTSGWYSVTVSSLAGCWDRNDSLYVTVHPLPPAPLVSDNVVVNTQASPTLPITGCEPFGPLLWATGVAPADQLVWTGPGINSTNDTIQANASGWHTATVTTPFGCTRITSTLVTIIPSGTLPQLEADYPIIFPQDDDLNDTIVICSNSQLNYSADVQLSLNGQPTGLPYGVTDLHNCNGSGWSASPPDLSYNCSRPIGQEGWYTVSLGVMLTNAPCGQDTLIFTRTDSVYVIPLPVDYPTILLSAPQYLCPGDTATATMSCTNCEQITWNGIGIEQDFMDSVWVVSQGGITLNVAHLNTNGCITTASASTSILWNPRPLLSVSPVDGIICPDSVAQIFSDHQGISYEWFGPFGPMQINNDSIVTGQQGLYYLEMVDSLNCLVTSDPILITDYATPYLNVLPDQMLCDESASATLQVITTSISTVQWLEPLAGNGLQQVVTEPGIYTCTVQSCGVTTQLSVEIYGSNAVAEVDQPGPLSLCTNDQLTLQAAPGMALYYWLPGPVFSDQLTVQQPGSYMLVVQDANGCKDSTTVVIEAINALPFDLGPDTLVCPGDLVTFAVPTGYVDPIWNGIGTDPFFTSGAGVVILAATDQNGCVNTDSTHVIEFVFTSALADTSVSICQGEDAFLSVDGSGIIHWYADPGMNDLVNTGPSILLEQPQENITYHLVQQENGCSSSTLAFTLLVIPLPDPVVINGPASACLGTVVTFSADAEPPIELVWSIPAGSINGAEVELPAITLEDEGVYTVIPFNLQCAGPATSTTIQVLVPVPIDLGLDTVFCEGGEFELKLPPDFFDPIWSTGSSAGTINITEPGTYSVVATDTQGCSTMGEIVIGAIDCELIVPNVFTPNGDGTNDTWSLRGGLVGCDARIYDRWGDMVYEGDVMQRPWNGRSMNGSLCSDGVYYYEIEVRKVRGANSKIAGYIQLRN